MGISNTEVDRLIKKKFGELEEAINATETELMKKDEEFDKSKATFHFARMQQLYVDLRFYISSKGLI